MELNIQIDPLYACPIIHLCIHIGLYFIVSKLWIWYRFFWIKIEVESDIR